MKELLTNYGPVALIWFDTPRMMTRRARPALHRHRALAAARHADRRPARRRRATIVRTGDNVIPPDASQRSVGSAGDAQPHLGLQEGRHRLEVAGQIIFKLVDIVSKGGNYLLNVGPTAEGVIPQPSQDNLRAVGPLAAR